MEQLIHKFAAKIGDSMGYDEEKAKVIAYGFTAIVQMISIFTLITVIGLLCGFWIEAVVSFFAAGLLRRSVGGAHSASYNGCLVMSTVTISFLAFVSSRAYLLNDNICVAVAVFIYLIVAVTVFVRAPLDNPRKRIKTEQKRLRLRRQAFITVGVYFAVTIVLLLIPERTTVATGTAVSLALSALWQAFVLTPAGIYFLNISDKLFSVMENGNNRKEDKP